MRLTHRFARKLFPLLAVTVLLSCTTKRTQVMIGVITNLTACDGLSKVTLNVYGGPNLDIPIGVTSNGTVVPAMEWPLKGDGCATAEPHVLPGSVAITAGDNSRALLELTGSGASGIIKRYSVVSLFKEKTLFMRMALVNECRNINCPSGETCVEGVCRPRPVGIGVATMSTTTSPLTIEGGNAVTAAHGGYHAERLLPEYRKDVEYELECQSAINNYRYSDPQYVPTEERPTMLRPKRTCPDGFFCEEGTCYQLPPVPTDGGVSDGPTGDAPMGQDGPNANDASLDGPIGDATLPSDAGQDGPTPPDGPLLDGPTPPDGPLPDAIIPIQWQTVQVAPATATDPNPAPLAYYPIGNQAVQASAAGGPFLWGGSLGRASLFNTYRWNLGATTSQVSLLTNNTGSSTGGATLPSVGATAYDASRGTVVTYRTLRDGNNALLHFVEEFNDNTWFETFPGAIIGQPAPGSFYPLPRDGAQIAYDAARSEVVFFGGACDDCCEAAAASICCASGALCDTWLWKSDAQSNFFPAWRVTGPKTKPAGRRNAHLAYHAGLQRVILFGGLDTNMAPLQDTWSWDGAEWAPLATTFPATVGKGVLLEDPSPTHPRILWVTFPGTGMPSEVFAFETTSWRKLRTYEVFPTLHSFSAIYDQTSNSVFVMGGLDANNAVSNQVWQLPLP